MDWNIDRTLPALKVVVRLKNLRGSELEGRKYWLGSSVTQGQSGKDTFEIDLRHLDFLRISTRTSSLSVQNSGCSKGVL